MTVAKVIEISLSSSKSIEDAVKDGLKRAAKTMNNIKGAWVNDIKVMTDDAGKVTEWRVNMRVNFVLDYKLRIAAARRTRGGPDARRASISRWARRTIIPIRSGSRRSRSFAICSPKQAQPANPNRPR